MNYRTYIFITEHFTGQGISAGRQILTRTMYVAYYSSFGKGMTRNLITNYQ